jgi:hypothetical protein
MAKMPSDSIVTIPDDGNDVGDATPAERAQLMIDERSPAYFQKTFRTIVGERTKPASGASREDDGPADRHDRTPL